MYSSKVGTYDDEEKKMKILDISQVGRRSQPTFSLTSLSSSTIYHPTKRKLVQRASHASDSTV